MPGKLILVRHGQSTWNVDNLFTGWHDVDLSDQGRLEAAQAGYELQREKIEPRIAFTSVLKRAIRTLWLILDTTDRMWIPVERSWRLNERHYGALEGLNKAQMVEKHGDWTTEQKTTQVVLTPAACYPCYPVIAKRGPLPAEGRTVDVYSYCFRHEPSLDPARMQMFRMREYVRMGTPDQIVEFRAMWIERGKALYAAAKKVGADAEFVSYPSTNHGFGQNFGTPSADDAFKRALAFLNKNLKGE